MADPVAAPEVHITSLIVQVRPEARDRVASLVSEMAGAESVEAASPLTVIAIFETDTLYGVTERIDAITRLDGVVNAALVFHQIERPEGLDDMIDVSFGQGPADAQQEVIP